MMIHVGPAVGLGLTLLGAFQLGHLIFLLFGLWSAERREVAGVEDGVPMGDNSILYR